MQPQAVDYHYRLNRLIDLTGVKATETMLRMCLATAPRRFTAAKIQNLSGFRSCIHVPRFTECGDWGYSVLNPIFSMSQGGVKPMRKLPTSETSFQKTSYNFTPTYSYFPVSREMLLSKSTGCLSETAIVLFKLKHVLAIYKNVRSAVPY